MTIKKRDIEILHAVKKTIDTDFQKTITIQFLSRTAGLGPVKLQNAFKQLFRIPIYTYLLDVRMSKARELLIQTDDSIKQIAAATGYKSTSSFTSAFKKAQKITPTAFRDQRLEIWDEEEPK